MTEILDIVAFLPSNLWSSQIQFVSLTLFLNCLLIILNDFVLYFWKSFLVNCYPHLHFYFLRSYFNFICRLLLFLFNFHTHQIRQKHLENGEFSYRSNFIWFYSAAKQRDSCLCIGLTNVWRISRSIFCIIQNTTALGEFGVRSRYGEHICIWFCFYESNSVMFNRVSLFGDKTYKRP